MSSETEKFKVKLNELEKSFENLHPLTAKWVGLLAAWIIIPLCALVLIICLAWFPIALVIATLKTIWQTVVYPFKKKPVEKDEHETMILNE